MVSMSRKKIHLWGAAWSQTWESQSPPCIGVLASNPMGVARLPLLLYETYIHLPHRPASLTPP